MTSFQWIAIVRLSDDGKDAGYRAPARGTPRSLARWRQGFTVALVSEQARRRQWFTTQRMQMTKSTTFAIDNVTVKLRPAPTWNTTCEGSETCGVPAAWLASVKQPSGRLVRRSFCDWHLPDSYRSHIQEVS